METTPQRGAWLALAAAVLGWMFDGFEMGLFPLVARPALQELLGAGSPHITTWIAAITAVFLVGAATGGVLFGWLGDRIGRVRAMTLSVLTYAIFSGLCGFAEQAWQLAALRFVASLGMGGEWSLGVALVMELWPNNSRAWLAGAIGAAANVGYMLIAVMSLTLNRVTGELTELLQHLSFSPSTIEWLTGNSGWRILMICGAMPAVLTFLIRLMVPESHKWEAQQTKGATKQWATRDLLGVAGGALAALGIVALWGFPLSTGLRVPGTLILIAAVLAGYLQPIRGYLSRSALPLEERRFILRRMLLAAGLSGVALLGTWGTTQFAPTWADELTGGKMKDAKAYTQMFSAFGASIGCVLAALLGGWIGRRPAYALLCVCSFASVVALYRLNDAYNTQLLVSVFIAGFITASFYGWLPLYLPELFPTSVRATGQGFGFNFGRIIAAIGVLQVPIIKNSFDEGFRVACPVMALIYVFGLVLIWFAPETKGKPLPE